MLPDSIPTQVTEQLRRLNLAYAHYADTGQPEKLASLFTTDGVWESSFGRAEGRKQIEVMFAGTPDRLESCCHIAGDVLVTAYDRTEATSISYFTSSIRSKGAQSVQLDFGYYDDRHSETPEGWRIASRVVRRLSGAVIPDLPPRMTNIDIVRAIQQGTVATGQPMFNYMHADVVVHEPASLPFGGSFHGMEGMRELRRQQDEVWKERSFEVLDYAQSGDRVVGLVTLRGTLRATGETIETRVTEWWTLRDGKVAAIEAFYADPTLLGPPRSGTGQAG